MMLWLSYAFLAVFAVSAAVHLVCCYKGSPKSAYTKPLLVSSLALFCLFRGLHLGSVPWLLIAALAASWLGDVLLMPQGNKWFVAGGISFLISHILFIFVYLPYVRWAAVLWWVAVPAALVYFGVSACVMKAIWKKTPGFLRVPMFLYLAANSVMNLFAVMLLTSAPSVGAALAVCGAALFFTSDCVLFLSRYWEKKDLIPKRGFIIMLTYIAGEALITFGVMMIEKLI